MPMMDPDYQAESDASTLQRAHEVQMDGKRHAGAKRHMRKQMASMKAAMSAPMRKGR